jgi:serine/threonine-protein kinase
MIDTVIGNFKIIKTLGKGGMSNVWLARHLNDNFFVAIKILDFKFCSATNVKNRFIKEANLLLRMNNPYIIKGYEFINDGHLIAIIMEYVEGYNLKEYIESNYLNNTQILNVFLQLANAVSYIHDDQNIVHRDLKPSNFMINKKFSIRLMDFGISKTFEAELQFHDETTIGTKMGTETYMSPEQIKGFEVNHTSDIYSLGVILWQMVTSIKPYLGMNSFDRGVSIVKEPLLLTNTLWDPIIQKATIKIPTHRYKSTNELINDLLLLRRNIKK